MLRVIVVVSIFALVTLTLIPVRARPRARRPGGLVRRRSRGRWQPRAAVWHRADRGGAGRDRVSRRRLAGVDPAALHSLCESAGHSARAPFAPARDLVWQDE